MMSELFNTVNVLSFVGFTLGIIGLFFTGAKKKEGWLIWLVGNCFWLIVYFMSHLWFAIVMTVVYQVLNVLTYFRWREDAKDKTQMGNS